MSERSPSDLVFPSWPFEQIINTPQTDCNKWLLVIRPDGEMSVDGCHSDAEGVSRAMYLHERIGMIRPPEGSRYLMMTLEPVPAFDDGGLDDGEIITLNLGSARITVGIEVRNDQNSWLVGDCTEYSERTHQCH